MATTDAVESAAAQLGAVLREAGFDAKGLFEALDMIELDQARALGAARPAIVDDPLATLVDLFHVRIPVARERAAAVAPVDTLLEAGLLAEHGDDVVSVYGFSPWLGAIVAHDVWSDTDVRPDYVAGGTRSAATLAQSTVRIPGARMLDMAAGSGVQALLGARHCRHVVAVDVNPRAVELTRINAALNDLPDIEARQGDWFEPVAGEEFDLVVCNPPYVVSPDTELLFRDGDRKPDDIHGVLPDVVRGVAGHLAPGGIGHVLCDWAVRDGEDTYDAVRSWTEGLGRDVCIVDFGSDRVLRYATRWNALAGRAASESYAETVARWLDHYERHGVTEFRMGLVVLRRGFSAEPWFHTVVAAGMPEGEGGRQLLRIIEAQDYLTSTGELAPRLEDERFDLVEGHSIGLRNDFREGEFRASATTIELKDRLGTRVTLDQQAVDVVLELDGTRTLGETLAGLAERSGADPAELTAYGIETVRELFALGLVVRL